MAPKSSKRQDLEVHLGSAGHECSMSSAGFFARWRTLRQIHGANA